MTIICRLFVNPTLTGTPVPPLFERCLQVTAAFEGHSYTVAAGNWDDAWLTWGVIGFTMKFGRVQEIVRAVAASAPQCVQCAGAYFGVADNSKPESRENVRRRKLALATGAGTANGVNVVLADWGLDDVAAVV